MTSRERVRYVALHLMSVFSKEETNDTGSVVFLAFHFLFEDNHGNFRNLLDWLSENYTFLTVSDAVSQVKAGNLTGRNVCFTCDDGFKSCLNAASILNDYEASCCFFLCPDFIGLGDEDRISFFNKNRLGGPPIEFLSWQDVEVLQNTGHEIGNHTLNHLNLGRIEESMVEDQIGSSLNILRRELGNVKHFACPYGQIDAYTRHAVDFCYSIGHETFFTTTRGLHRNGDTLENGLLKRQHFEPFWPQNHTEYFLKSGG